MVDLRRARQQVQYYTGKVGDARYPLVRTLLTGVEFAVSLLLMVKILAVIGLVEIKRDEQEGEVRIFTDAGRILRPHLVVENLSKVKSFKAKRIQPRGFLGYELSLNGAWLKSKEMNQEDSLVMNRASMERGMFRSEHIRSYKAEVDNKETQDKRRKADDLVNFGKGSVQNLLTTEHTERGMVQKVVLSSNDDDKNFAVVSLRQIRSPTLGNKFSSMHGQKGVLGFLESQENFPFTIQGIVPDVVINPHAFPSRQTPAQLLEAALGKGIACGGLKKYATPFSTPSFDAITEQLHRVGFSKSGMERVYNGCTGEMVRSLIFMGPTFYKRLVHMVEDKVKFRNTGPVHPLTQQPVVDRKRFGGIKFDEMERNCLIAHGASANLNECLFTLSDSSQVLVCRKCKNVASVIQCSVGNGRKVRGPYCCLCETGGDIVKGDVPHGAKLLCQELFSMGICLKFETELC
ncbi:hypothetical protein EZV62_007257 [Acer yangbiense]|uniref:DNA-directed RNA polymerase n=1 Tax=Acer yangbiense TaxID=1000413 RepID=A0A5C7IBB2_9ROSI|nr:hypothetical protein EZV62_007257 [Acer yangbiense]